MTKPPCGRYASHDAISGRTGPLPACPKMRLTASSAEVIGAAGTSLKVASRRQVTQFYRPRRHRIKLTDEVEAQQVKSGPPAEPGEPHSTCAD